MAATQSRIELILDLKNRIGAGLAQAKKQINSDVGSMQSKFASFTSSPKRGFSSFADELPIASRGLSSLATPATAAAAAVGLIATGLMKASDRAAEFNSNFRELANLNLDKSQQEINDLRKLVLDTAWKKGFGADETSGAYNEIQSTIGVYGREAREIVEKQGEFAKVFQANMGEYVAGTAKAMANWRFGNDRLDDFNKSAYATMQVGVVSFEQLSKVQSVYAGAAASVKQDFDTANKLFSLFTVRTKSVDEAATLTKSLFNDLTKKTTVDAFKKIGINFYDTNGQLKQADTIMLELNKKFMSMKNDKSVIALKNQFTGSEGLIAMIQAATDKSGQLKATFDEFTNSKMNFDNAANMAQQDILYRQEKLSKRIDNLIIRLGQIALPWKEKLVGFAENLLDNPKNKKRINSDDAYNNSYNAIRGLFDGNVKNARTMPQAEYDRQIAALQNKATESAKGYEDLTNKYNSEADKRSYVSKETQVTYFDRVDKQARQKYKAASDAYLSIASDMQKARSNPDYTPFANNRENKQNSDNNNTTSNLESALTRVTGAAQAPRNLYVTIGSLISGGINTQNTKLQNMDVDQIEDVLTDLCMRVVHNIETSYN